MRFRDDTKAGVLRRSRATVAIAAIVLAIAVPGLLRLELRTDGAALVPSDDPAIVADREVRERFGLRDLLLVVLETDHEDGVYNQETLARLEALTRDLGALDGVEPDDVVSLATEYSARIDGEASRFYGLLDPPPENAERLAEVESDIEAAEIFHGTLISYDRTALAVLVGVPAAQDHVQAEAALDRRDLYHRVAATAGAYEGDGHQVSVVGAPAAEALLGEHILEDLALLIPLVFLVVGVVLRLACGRFSAAAIGLTKVGAAQLFTFGLIGWCGVPVYLTTAMIPVVLATLGIADEVHLLWSFYRESSPEESVEQAVERTLGALTRPVVFTSITTSVGFCAFLFSSLRPVASFGLFTACGVLFSMAWSLRVTPVLWSLLPPSARTAEAKARLPKVFAGASPSRRRMIAVAVLLIAVAAGLPRLSVQDSWVHNFAEDSSLRTATEKVDRLFAGTHTLYLALIFDSPEEEIATIPAASGALLAPAAVRRVEAFEDSLRERPEPGTIMGLASHLSVTSFLWGERREESRKLIDNPHWIYLHIRRIANVRGEPRRRELVDDEYRGTVITALLKGADYRKTAGLIEAARRLEREILPVHARLELAGDLAVSQAMIPAIVRTQVGSLLLALVGCAMVASLLFRSLRLGLAAAAPSTGALLCTLGLFGWLGIPLGVASSMFCAVTLGIGVDYSIHLLAREQRLREQGSTRPAREALRAVSPAILIDSAAAVLGFGLLLFSQVPTNRHLGLAVAATLATCAVLTLGGLGASRARGETS